MNWEKQIPMKGMCFCSDEGGEVDDDDDEWMMTTMTNG